MGISDTIKHFEALQKRYTKQHNGTACEHVMLALEGLRRMAEGPEVVRCEECRFEPDCNRRVKPNGVWEHLVGYCSHGERKEGEHGGVD